MFKNANEIRKVNKEFEELHNKVTRAIEMLYFNNSQNEVTVFVYGTDSRVIERIVNGLKEAEYDIVIKDGFLYIHI